MTETQLLENTDLISHRVSQFRQYGVRIAIDDFGTGYSNLDAINSFSFDRLKVDRRFVNGVSGSERISALFKFIHGVADLLGVELLSEGVERIDDLLWLKDRGACCVQGWYFSVALTAAEIVKVLVKFRDCQGSASPMDFVQLRELFSVNYPV